MNGTFRFLQYENALFKYKYAAAASTTSNVKVISAIVTQLTICRLICYLTEKQLEAFSLNTRAQCQQSLMNLSVGIFDECSRLSMYLVKF